MWCRNATPPQSSATPQRDTTSEGHDLCGNKPAPHAGREHHGDRRSPTPGRGGSRALVLFLGVRGTLTVGAVLQIVPVILLLVSPVRALRDMPVPPARTAVPPAREGAA